MTGNFCSPRNSIGPFQPGPERTDRVGPAATLSDLINQRLSAAYASDWSILIGGDQVPRNYGLERASAGLPEWRFRLLGENISMPLD